jgi:NitT/TauT family transport system substrate-binding protein
MQLKTHESGLESLNELLAGKIDLATITEFLFARQIAEHPDLRILSVVGQTDNMKLVARKDRGIKQESDLKSKRIGLVRDSIAEYHLHLFLLLHRIPWKDIQPVDLPPSEEVKSIIRGDVDAAIVWEPFAKQMQEGLGQNAMSWSAQSGQDFYWLLVGTKDIVKRRSSAIQGVIAALVSAEDVIKKQRNEARRIVASQIGPNHMPELWETSGFTLNLSRPVILAIEAELTWMNSSQGVQEFKVPNLMDYVHFETLESVNPEKVKTLR